jgi:hypothetical protein
MYRGGGVNGRFRGIRGRFRHGNRGQDESWRCRGRNYGGRRGLLDGRIEQFALCPHTTGQVEVLREQRGNGILLGMYSLNV